MGPSDEDDSDVDAPGLGNRRKLATDLRGWFGRSDDAPRLLMLFDLAGFKAYNPDRVRTLLTRG